MIDTLGEVASGTIGGMAKSTAPTIAETGLKTIVNTAPRVGVEAVGAATNIANNIPEAINKGVEDVAARSLADTMERALASRGPDSALGELLEAKPEDISGQDLSSLRNESVPVAEPNTITTEGLQSNDNTASTLSSEPAAAGSTSEPNNLTDQRPITSGNGTKAETAEGEVPAGETPAETVPQIEQELRELTPEQRMERLEQKMDSLTEKMDEGMKKGEEVDENLKKLLEEVEKLKKAEEARKKENEELARQNEELAKRIEELEKQQGELLATIADVDDKRRAEIVQVAEAKQTEARRLTENLSQQKQAA